MDTIKITVSWDPSMTFETSKVIEISILYKESTDVTRFKGKLIKPNQVLEYLEKIHHRATGNKPFDLSNKLTQKQTGKKNFCIKVTRSTSLKEQELQDEMYGLKFLFKLVQKDFFMVTRNERVTFQEYCAFYGSDSSFFREKCFYPKGDFIETLRQTVYDMEHVYSKAYGFTNVPDRHSIREWLAGDVLFLEFFKKEIRPLIVEYDKVKASSLDKKVRMEWFTKIADVTEEYKSKYGVKSVKLNSPEERFAYHDLVYPQ